VLAAKKTTIKINKSIFRRSIKRTIGGLKNKIVENNFCKKFNLRLKILQRKIIVSAEIKK
jgi:hypothetical protein